MNTIHPTAIIHDSARLGENNTIGPNVVIEADVELGNANQLMSGVVLNSGARIGSNNRFHEYVVIAGLPQDISFNPDEKTTVEIGNNNTFREYVTINRATTKENRVTRVGSDNYFMTGTHVGHDCAIGNRVVVAPSTGFGGHVHIDDGAFISGGVMVHQFVKIGRLAMIGGNAKITQDVLPYFITDGVPATVKGINVVGLKRAGFTASDIKVLKQAFRELFGSTRSLEEIKSAIAAMDNELTNHLAAFIVDSKRSFHRQEKKSPA